MEEIISNLLSTRLTLIKLVQSRGRDDPEKLNSKLLLEVDSFLDKLEITIHNLNQQSIELDVKIRKEIGGEI